MNTIEHIYSLYLKHPDICTDTRKITRNCLFFALKGENFDANTFAKQAIEQGAAYTIVDNPAFAEDKRYILVDDVLTALQKLAIYHRRQLNIPVIGLTGTNGKTTTKELINAVLSQSFNTLATQGNLNNHIGVPLTILKINNGHQMAVIEMGANHQHEIELLCTIAQPTHGLITNVGKAHLEGFGGVEGVKKGKGELYDYLSKAGDERVAFINADDNTLAEMQQQRKLANIVYYGKSNDPKNLINGKLLENSPLLKLVWNANHTETDTHEVATQLTGTYNLDNILAAICIGCYFKISPEAINKGIADYQPKNNRSQITHTATNTLICDYYNANPSSMAVAIENLDKIYADKKILILGDMFEMGSEAAIEHVNIIEKAFQANVDERIFIGKAFESVRYTIKGEGKEAQFYATAEDAITALKARPVMNATILIKGSRGMALEKLVELF
ncbi:UDP-N-acetylmuramoyl-tripeptide--D-alanyl-D-alanine ligase [Mucilaginibacter segetis]|uniref:UDP-N-acetylmuramoyl-tripeptide--D-alanyl-D-alanine ligase n=1 Tax=Mucilaginibacter segetis TaxID=2793071 RepID=A0A934PSD0_9SPHI|nr:UDP-N-acetylmuramoyl-tripeptide--D-alanyl-D-alanine ligase [Mucilaginibacter segetis]MBK0379924.1 UDP-N-acetylmuramoyl-tripeptide--D-alanyl-D-alanine ligase [Mucilaginibacter segetis]